MKQITEPAAYEAWYHTPRGRWIGDREFVLLRTLLRPETGASRRDIGNAPDQWPDSIRMNHRPALCCLTHSVGDSPTCVLNARDSALALP